MLPSLQGTLCQQEREASCEIQLILQPAHTPPSGAGQGLGGTTYSEAPGFQTTTPLPLPSISSLLGLPSSSLSVLFLLEDEADLRGYVAILKKKCCILNFDLQSLKA